MASAPDAADRAGRETQRKETMGVVAGGMADWEGLLEGRRKETMLQNVTKCYTSEFFWPLIDRLIR
jgi:hypothetical protein